MSTTTSTIALWLFVINLGIAFGAGAYEHRIVVSRWIGSSVDSGAHGMPKPRARTTPDESSGFTFSYFIPAMVGLMVAPDSPESVAIATRRSNLNYLRHAIVLAAWLAALKTSTLFQQQHG